MKTATEVVNLALPVGVVVVGVAGTIYAFVTAQIDLPAFLAALGSLTGGHIAAKRVLP